MVTCYIVRAIGERHVYKETITQSRQGMGVFN